MVSSYKNNMSRVMRKPTFCICENKDPDQLRGTAKLISAFVFATRIVQSLFFLNPKFQISSHLLWLCSSVCVGPGRKPDNWFSHDAAHMSASVLCFSVHLYTTGIIFSSLSYASQYITKSTQSYYALAKFGQSSYLPKVQTFN